MEVQIDSLVSAFRSEMDLCSIYLCEFLLILRVYPHFPFYLIRSSVLFFFV